MIGSFHRRGQLSAGRLTVVLLAKLAVVGLAAFMLRDGWGQSGAALAIVHLAVVAAVLLLFRRDLGKIMRLGRGPHAPGKSAEGILIHKAAGYDRTIRLLTLGREGRLRARMLAPIDLQPGERVLDAACGTGTLAIAAFRQVAPTGTVSGIDASPEMIARARTKAAAARVEITFAEGSVAQMPFEDGSFDVVTASLMFHHLSRPLRLGFVSEARRVLTPGGRLVLIDFGRPNPNAHLPRWHRHGSVDMATVGQWLGENGFSVQTIGAVGMWNLRYLIARPVQDAQRMMP